MNPDESPSPAPPESDGPPAETPPEQPFEFGDRTIFTLRAQSFAIDNEYGTMVMPMGPISRETTEMPMPPLEFSAEPVAEAGIDPIERLEQKVDTALRLIQSLQQQLDSIDATLARALNR